MYVTSTMAGIITPSEKLEELQKVFFRPGETPHEWGWLLEDYEILFPETAESRKALLDRQSKITASLFDFHASLRTLIGSPLERFEEIFSERVKKHNPQGRCMDQLGLVEDLKIHLQNRVLSRITGNRVPHREPPDPSVPRIAESPDGDLIIVEGRNKSST
jgi:hypothetical protein